MSITNITRTNTVDEWRIQTNLSAGQLNALETGTYEKTAGILTISGNSNVSITATGTALQVSNAAIFSTNVSIGKELALGARETTTGNIGVGNAVSIYGPGNALIVANSAVVNTNLQVTKSLTTNNITVNANTVVIGTTNTGFLGVANTAYIGKTLTVVGNTTSGNLISVAAIDGVDGRLSSTLKVALSTDVGTALTVGTTAAVGQSLTVGTFGSFGSFLAAGSNASVGTTLTVTGNTTVGNLITANTVHAGAGNISGTLVAVGNTTVGNLTTANAISGGTGRISSTLIVTGNTTVGNLITANTVHAGNANISGTMVVVGNTTAGNLITSNTVSARNIDVSETLVVVGNTTAGNLNTANTVTAANMIVSGNVDVGNLNSTRAVSSSTLRTTDRADIGGIFHSVGAATFDSSAYIAGDLTVASNFVVSGDILYDTDNFILSSVIPVTSGYAYLGVNRGVTSGILATGSGANAYIRWDETNKQWQIRNVDSTDNASAFSKILTANLISASLTTVSNSVMSSTWVVKNYADNANTNMKNYVDVANTKMQSYVDVANTSMKSYVDVANTKMQSYVDTTVETANTKLKQYVDTYAGPAFQQANGAFAAANLTSNTFNGTSGTARPVWGVITYSSTNGVTVAGATNVLTINTPQDLRTTASPTFAGLSLTAALPLTQGGTGATSAAGALTTLLPTGTTAGYVLTTGGPGTYYWAAQTGSGGGGTAPGTTINTSRLFYTASLGQTLFETPTYVPGASQLRVYINGVRQYNSDYTETSAISVTLGTGCAAGDTVMIEVDGYIDNPRYANNINYSVSGTIPATLGTYGTTIQQAIDYLETSKAKLSGATFTGTVSATTAGLGTSDTTLATTSWVKSFANTGNTFTCSITGNAGTVTNGLYSTGSYANPSWISSLASAKVTGLAASATSDTTSATNITTGTLNTARLDDSGVTVRATAWGGLDGTTGQVPVIKIDSKGRVTYAANVAIAINTSQITGLATSATTDTTSATNITSGTLPAARLPASGAVAGSYIAANITVDSYGRVTTVSDGTQTSIVGTTNQIIASNPTGVVTLSLPQSIATTSSVQFGSIGVGTVPTGTTGEIRATNDITAYYSSDARLKTNIEVIDNALEKISQINGVKFDWNETAREMYPDRTERDVGIIAQEIEKVLPEVVTHRDNGYMAVRYEKIIALLIEGVKELKQEIEELKRR